MQDKFKIDWIDQGRPPRVAPDPNFPDGKHICIDERPACTVELPYMVHENIGYWYVECNECNTNVLITMASRPDDPKSVMIKCNK